MKTFTCPTCKKEWPDNYCLMCGQIIDKTCPPPATLGLSDNPQSVAKAPVTTTVPPDPSAKRGRNDCPVCGSQSTDRATGKFKAAGFQAFPNRSCYTCDAAWKPACPRWAAVICIVAGVAAFFLLALLFEAGGTSNSISSHFTIGFFAFLPVLYGLAVLVGLGGKMKILSKGKNRLQ